MAKTIPMLEKDKNQHQIIQDKINQIINAELAQRAENTFVKDVYENNMTSLEILNWYRNLYYKEGKDTERGLMVEVINDLFTHYSIELKE